MGGKWENPYPVHEDGWMIPGCPVNGPKLAEKDGKIAIAWFTAPEGDSQINVAFSDDSGKSFSSPIRIDAGKPIGRVDIGWLNDESVTVSWLEANDENASLVYRTLGRKGPLSEVMEVETLAGGRGIGYPQFEMLGEKILFLWTDPIEKTQIKSKWIAL